ncbi:hypothetical protein FJY84_01010 [Candidatus Bathyarchaeota archaeon]|nr:hypothetical protein [Candidatus Bathyarchaeota archaeon]
MSDTLVGDSIKDVMNMEHEKITKMNVAGNSMNGIARAYTIAYSCCYILSPFFGLQLTMWGSIVSAILLIGIGVSLLAAIFTRNKFLLLILGVVEAAGCVAHFLHVIPWAPAFSDTAYIIMSLLDLTQSLLLFILIQWNE